MNVCVCVPGRYLGVNVCVCVSRWCVGMNVCVCMPGWCVGVSVCVCVCMVCVSAVHTQRTKRGQWNLTDAQRSQDPPHPAPQGCGTQGGAGPGWQEAS